MVNTCWEDDTLFMIFEEDFRFEPENEDSEPQFVTQQSFQEVVGQSAAGPGGRPTYVTSELRVVLQSLSQVCF